MPREVIQVRVNSIIRQQIEDLAEAWGGGVRPLTVSDVIRELVRQAHLKLPARTEKPPRKSRKVS